MSCNVENKKIELSVYNGDFSKYDEETKKKFLEDFVENKVYRNGMKVSAGSTEEEILKCYEHITSEGCINSKARIPDLRRYESIYMLKDILSSKDCLECKHYLIWEKESHGLKEMIFCPESGYYIVLLKRKFVYKIVTAFNITSQLKKESLIEECKKFATKKGSP